MFVIPAPIYSLAQAAWIPRITIWRDDGTMQHRKGEPCESWAAAMAASWSQLQPEIVLGTWRGTGLMMHGYLPCKDRKGLTVSIRLTIIRGALQESPCLPIVGVLRAPRSSAIA